MKRHTCEKADGYFDSCPECDEEERIEKEEAKKWQNQKFFCNACGKECLINDKYGGFRHWRTCGKKCYNEIEMRAISHNIRKDYEPWSTKEKDND